MTAHRLAPDAVAGLTICRFDPVRDRSWTSRLGSGQGPAPPTPGPDRAPRRSQGFPAHAVRSRAPPLSRPMTACRIARSCRDPRVDPWVTGPRLMGCRPHRGEGRDITGHPGVAACSEGRGPGRASEIFAAAPRVQLPHFRPKRCRVMAEHGDAGDHGPAEQGACRGRRRRDVRQDADQHRVFNEVGRTHPRGPRSHSPANAPVHTCPAEHGSASAAHTIELTTLNPVPSR